MQSTKNLYAILLEMEFAAEKHDKKEVIRIRDIFISEYNRMMPRNYQKDSLPYLYDVARNKILGAVDDTLFPTLEERCEQLKEAKTLIARIPKPD